MPEIAPEVTVASTTVYGGSLIKVRRDTVRLPKGGTASREIVEHPPVVAIIAEDGDRNLVLVRQYRKPIEDITLEIPAGAIEPNEGAADAAHREMVEETGLDPGGLREVSTIYSSPGFSDEVMHLFYAWDLRGDGQPTESSDEIEVVRVEYENARNMVFRGEITDAKSVAGILMLESPGLHNESGAAARR